MDALRHLQRITFHVVPVYSTVVYSVSILVQVSSFSYYISVGCLQGSMYMYWQLYRYLKQLAKVYQMLPRHFHLRMVVLYKEKGSIPY